MNGNNWLLNKRTRTGFSGILLINSNSLGKVPRRLLKAPNPQITPGNPPMSKHQPILMMPIGIDEHFNMRKFFHPLLE